MQEIPLFSRRCTLNRLLPLWHHFQTMCQKKENRHQLPRFILNHRISSSICNLQKFRLGTRKVKTLGCLFRPQRHTHYLFVQFQFTEMIHQAQRSSSISVHRPKESTSFTGRSDIAASTTSTQIRSQSIPISNSHFHRTASEIQLCLDEQIAELRDHLFYSRVVTGIEQTKMCATNRTLQKQNEMCLAHIMQTRTDATPYQKSLTFPSLPENDDWSIGLPIDHVPSTMLSEQTITHDARTIPADTIALANQTDDQGMIFDLDLWCVMKTSPCPLDPRIADKFDSMMLSLLHVWNQIIDH